VNTVLSKDINPSSLIKKLSILCTSLYVDKGTKVKHLVEGANSLQTDLMRLAGWL